ncbi:MAG: HEAT repeat domain-containing protein [Planctomycetota bacterium]
MTKLIHRNSICRALLTRSASQLIAVTLAVVLLAFPVLASAQDNPFGGGNQDNPFGGTAPSGNQDNPFGQNNPFGSGSTGPDRAAPAQGGQSAVQGQQAAIDPSLPEPVRLVIESVRNSNPTTAMELARVARTLNDIEQYDEARFYMQRLIQLSPPDQTMFELEQVIGVNFFFEIHSSDFLQPEGTQLAAMVLSGARRAATAPERIDGLIRGLSNDNISLRSEAFRALRRLGNPATAELIHVFTDAGRVNEYPFIRGALRNMGETAVRPLVGAAHSDDAQVQLEAVRALEAYPSSEASDAMLRVYLSTRVSEEVRRLALESMENQNDVVANRTLAAERLYQRANDYLTGVRRLPGDHNTVVELWRWNSATKRLEQLLVPRATAQQMMAAERARDLVEIQPQERRNRQLYLLTELESFKRQNGPNIKVPVQHFQPVLGQVNADDVANVLATAMEMNLIPAACGACELLQQIGSINQVTSSLGRQGILIDALLSGDRHLQFAAFEAIAQIDPKTAYTGSSYMTSLAVFLASTQGGGAALVGHQRVAIAQTYATSLGPSGVYPAIASSGRDLLKTATTNPDFEAIFITDSMARPDYIELAQQLRSDWRTKRTPVCMLVHDDFTKRRVERVLQNDPFLIVLPATFDQDDMASHMRQLRRLAQPWGVTPQQRRIHADVAMRWLARVANDRQAYSFYELGGHEAALVRMLYTPTFAVHSSNVLAGLGTPSAQQELVNFASQNGLAIDDRKAAAQAFGRSVEVSGVLLTTQQIQLQYDRYNASDRQPIETQRVLGAILDAIEGRARRPITQMSPAG